MPMEPSPIGSTATALASTPGHRMQDFTPSIFIPASTASSGSIDFKYESPYGEIKSAWVVKGSDVDWAVTIPANTTARLPLPATRASAFTIDGKPLAENPNVSLLSEEAGTKVFKLAAGSYTIKTTNQ